MLSSLLPSTAPGALKELDMPPRTNIYSWAWPSPAEGVTPRILTMAVRFCDANIPTRGEVPSAHGAVRAYEGAVFVVSTLKGS